jgi:hypothetical protein
MIDLRQYFYNPGYGWYEVETTLRGQCVIVYVSGRGSNDTAALSQRVNQGINWIIQHYDAILDYGVEQLLPDKNADWADEPGNVTTPEAFKAAMRLGALRFHADRQIEMTFTAGKLFRGNWIVIWLDGNYQMIKAYLEG